MNSVTFILSAFVGGHENIAKKNSIQPLKGNHFDVVYL
jgi:hypothetical protein